MNTQNQIYPYNTFVFGNKKEWSFDHTTAWMNLDNIMLSERNQTQKATYVWFYLYEMSKINKYRETESRVVSRR